MMQQGKWRNCTQMIRHGKKKKKKKEENYLKCLSNRIKKLRSDEKIREMEELYSENERERIQKLYSQGNEIDEFLDMYLGDKAWEFKNMYKKLSDDDKEPFLHKYNDCWRNTILKYLELNRRWLQNLYEGTSFQIWNLLKGDKEGKEVLLSIDVKKGVGELQKELLRIYDYLRDIEVKYDDRRVLSEYEQQFYLNLSYIAQSSDDILDHIMSNDVARDMHSLLETIHNFYRYNLSSTQFKLKVVVRDNINNGGPQSLGNVKFSINPSMPSKDNQYSRPKSYGHVPNRHLVGFKCEIQMWLNHLIQPHLKTRAVGIVGIGGAGKTTLAKHIYHHPEIKTRFASKVWVCISQSWDKTIILNSIWRQVAQNPMASEMGYDQVVDRLSELLHSKSYLIILDDIWSIDAWYDISPALPPRTGTKVVVTTRNKFLPQRIDPGVLIVEPKQLNDKESYELFRRGAFLPNDDIPHHLLPLAIEMVKKCKGLPLAIVALAGVLALDKRKSSWERMSKRLTDNILRMANDSTQGVVKEILALSFYELPHFLKPCVLYLRVFPEDYEIETQQLIQMWIAECFIDEEYVAEEYLDEMARRSIVEVVKTNCEGQVDRLRVHDLIRQMFVDINQERGLFKDSLRLVPSTTASQCLETNTHARSLIFFNHLKDVGYEQQWFSKFSLLRVLIIRDTDRTMLEEIGNLIHLRYIALGGYANFPRFIVNLKNLWTLDTRYLNSVWDKKEVCTLYSLKELRHLYLPENREGWAKIAVRKAKLRTLWNAVGGEWMLSGMSELSAVLRELCIRRIKSKEQLEAVFRTPSMSSSTLHTLELHWSNWDGTLELCDMSILGKCRSLKKLS